LSKVLVKASPLRAHQNGPTDVGFLALTKSTPGAHRSDLTCGLGTPASAGMDRLSPPKAADPQRVATYTIAHRGIWVKSQLLAEIRIPSQVAEGKRHLFFKGIREDLARSRLSRRNRNATPTRIPFLCGQYRTDATGMKGRLRVCRAMQRRRLRTRRGAPKPRTSPLAPLFD
jgi:hypothetical protein